jgi:hypothetical protein
MTTFHTSCTCKIGKVDDPSAAVDAKARVIGLQKLMAIDASAFPLLPPVIQCLLSMPLRRRFQLIYLRAKEAMKDVANGSNASV